MKKLWSFNEKTFPFGYNKRCQKGVFLFMIKPVLSNEMLKYITEIVEK